MQGGVHLLVGLIIAMTNKRKGFKFGAVLGSILPDFDLLPTAIAVVLAQDINMVYVMHRTYLHSFLFIIISVSIVIYFLSSPSHEIHIFNRHHFALGLTCGMLSHIFIDIFYLAGVVAFWPFYMKPIGPFGITREWLATPFAEKITQATDYFFEIFLFYVPIIFMINSKRHLSSPELFNKTIKYVIFEALVSFLLVALAFYDHLSLTWFYVIAFTPGTMFTMISIVAPYVFREAICELTSVDCHKSKTLNVE